MKTNRRSNKIVTALLGSALVLQHAAPASAAQSVYSTAVVANNTPGQITEDFTLTVGVDWDWDAGVKQVNSNEAVALDRDAIKKILTDASTLIYAATESRHMIKKIYVYRNVKDTNYDVTLLNGHGNNLVDLAGWGKPNKQNVITLSHEVLSISNGAVVSNNTPTPITNADVGGTVGVEVARGLLSYLYGLASEGQSPGIPCNVNPATSCDTDSGAQSLLNPNAKNSAGGAVRRLTTPMDYIPSRFFLRDEEKARLAAAPAVTAQQRVWATSTDFGPDKTYAVGASAWEMLSRPVSSDPKGALGLGRTAFPALADYDWQKIVPNGTGVPTTLPEIVFVDTVYRKDVVLVDIYHGKQADRDNRLGAVAPILQAAAEAGGSLSQFAMISTPALAEDEVYNPKGTAYVYCPKDMAVLPQKNPANNLIGAAAKKEIAFSQNKADGGNDAQYKPSAADLQAVYEKFVATAKSRVKPGMWPATCKEDYDKYSFDNAVQYAVSVLNSDTTRIDGGFSTIHYITDAEPGLSEETLKMLKKNRITLNTLLIKPTNSSPAPASNKRVAQSVRSAGVAAPAAAASAALSPLPTGTLSLAKLAALTGGNAATAKTGAEAAKKMAQSSNELQGRAESTIYSNNVEPLAAEGSQTLSFRLASRNVDKDVSISLYFDGDDIQKVTPSLRDPSGAVVVLPKPTESAAKGSVSGYDYNIQPSAGTYEITVPAKLAARASGGEWGLNLFAASDMSEALSVEVAAQGGSAFNVAVIGGTMADKRPLVITAELGSGQKKALNASLVATVYDREGNVVLENLALVDDGQNGDYVKGDGVYTANLGGKLPLGEYEVSVEATVGGTAKWLDGTAAESFTREAETEFLVEDQTTLTQFAEAADKAAADSAVKAAAAAEATKKAAQERANAAADAASGGGCSTNPLGRDASLVLLSAWAALALMLRRRNPLAAKR